MDEPSFSNPCNISYDENNMSHLDNVKFRRCYGSVKIKSRFDNDEEGIDEFDVIIDKVKNVNEDVVLTRECNNFDLVCLDRSHTSLNYEARSFMSPGYIGELHSLKNDSTQIKSTQSSPRGRKLLDNANNAETDVCEEEDNDCTSNRNLLSRIGTRVADDSSLNSDTNEEHSDLLSNASNKELLVNLMDSSMNDLEEASSDFKNRQKCAKSVTFTDGANALNPPNLISVPNNYLSKDQDSDDSSKWNRKALDKVYNPCYFYRSRRSTDDNICQSEDDIKPEISEDESDNLLPLQNVKNLTSGKYLNSNETLLSDNDSIKSNESSLQSTSSAFESAMSSNDMMSPFGTPRNSLSLHSSVGYANSVKKSGINFASLTSENIPNTLNRISMHKAIEKNFIKNKLNYDHECDEKKEKDTNQSLPLSHNKIHSSHSIRKLLNMTSHKKHLTQSEQKLFEKFPSKHISSDGSFQRIDSIKSISLKSRDKKINIKEFYTSRRKKLKSLIETEKLNDHLATFFFEGGSRKSNHMPDSREHSCVQPSKLTIINEDQSIDSFQHTKIDAKYKSENLIKNQLASGIKESKSKFLSKIPRPISRRELRQKSSIKTSVKSCGYDNEGSSFYRNSVSNLCNSKSEKSETISRPSEGSDCSSYKPYSSNSRYRAERLSFKNSSKMLVNNAQIDSLRSRYWIKEDKVNFAPTTGFQTRKEEIKQSLCEAEKKKAKSTINVAFPSRQNSRLSYGKMIRVKTAPNNKSLSHIRDKSIVREASRLASDQSGKKNQKPSKVVSTGAFDVNKFSHQ